MTVRKVIEESAELLGVEFTDKNLEFWLNAYNNVENELSMYYFPLRAVDKVLITENKVKYGDLQRQARRIMGVYDCDHKELKYKLYPQHIGFAKKENGKYCLVRYCYIPQEKAVDGISDFDDGMFKDIFEYGVCAEYCLMQGNFELASMFDNKYKDGIKEKYAYKKGE